MPTGYTDYLLQNNLGFTSFALLCARNFGALISMRCDSFSKPIPKQLEIDLYYETQIKELEDKISKWEQKSPAEQIEQIKLELINDLEEMQEIIDKRIQKNKKLERVLAEAKKWEPPTENHTELKQFMISQLEISIQSIDYFEMKIKHTKEVLLDLSSISEKVTARSSDLHKSLDSAKQSYLDECKLVQGRNEWLTQLRESLLK